MEVLPVAAYLLAFAVAAALGAPIAALAFDSLPRRGAAFAIPTALVSITIATFWLGQLSFGVHTLAVAVGLLLAGSVLAIRRGARPEWRAVAGGYAVFALAFLLMVAIRGADPGLTPTGGEQFLHLGIANAIERAPALPPEDVWFAGEPLRYYYGSQLQVTSVAMLTGTPLRLGFNLGVAAFYGVLAVAAYGLAGAIVARRGHSYRVGGGLGVFFVALAGHTTTPTRLLIPHLPDVVGNPARSAAFDFMANRFADGNVTAIAADFANPIGWNWWDSRYVVQGTLHEVPLYSFVKGDLHGHALTLGYVLFAAALAFAYCATPATERWRRRGLLVGGLGAVAGVFGFTNTWALPTAGGLAVLAVGAAEAHPTTLLPQRWATALVPEEPTGESDVLARTISEAWRLLLALVVGVVVVAVGVAVAAPFLVFGHVPTNEGIGLFPPRSDLFQFLVAYAGLFVVFVLYLAWRVRSVLGPARDRWLLAGGLALVALVAVSLPADLGVLALVVPLVAVAWVVVRAGRGDFALVLMVAGAGLLVSLELVHARLPLIDNPRWNTSLKVAVQGWTLAAAGAGAAATVLFVRSRDRLAAFDPKSGDAVESRRIPRTVLLAGATLALLVMVVLASAVFPLMVGGQEIGAEVVRGNYTASLDGHHAIEHDHANETAPLRWLDRRSGTPTVVEAPGNSYDWTSPASTFSGLPSVVGWRHEAEYRGEAAYERRVGHVDAIYNATVPNGTHYLARYDVRYVYVGPNERGRYGDRLQDFTGSAFSEAYENDAVTIYEVNQSRLE